MAVALAVSTAVRRRARFVLTVWLGCVLPLIAYAFTAVPRYTARGAIQVGEAGSPLASNPLSGLAGVTSKASVETEVEILKRREFMADVLTRAGLQLSDPKQARWVTSDLGVALAGQSPVDQRLRALRRAAVIAEVPAAKLGRERVLLSVPAAGQLRARIGGPDGDSAEFVVGELFEHDSVRMQFSRDPLSVGEAIEFELIPEGELIEQYEDAIEVANLLSRTREPTNIVQISVTSTDRETARDIVQAMMERYLEKSLEWKTQSASQAAEFIEGQLREVRRSLAEAEARLREYSQQQHAVQLDTQAKVAVEQAAELEAQRMTIELQEKTISSVLGRIQNGTSPKASITANFFEDPVLAAAVQGLTEAETAFETLRASHTGEHPRVQELGRALALHKREVAGLMRSAQRNLANQRNQLEEKLAASTEAMKKYPEQQIELARLMREMSASERVYTLLLEKHEEAQIMKASTTTDKRIVDAASLPHRRTSPRRGLLALFGILGGLLAAMGAAFVANALERRIDTVDAVREEAPFPSYGTVPVIADANGHADHLTPQEVWAKPHEAAPEAFRALAVSVSLLPTGAERGRVVMVTSSQPREGKSTITSGVAVAMARMGKRVLVIDLDLRKPALHRVWKVPRAPGYSDLVGQAGTAQSLGRLAHHSAEFGTTLLTAGTPLPDTVAAVMAPLLSELISAWRREFDWIVIDSPPAFVAETAALAQHADLVLLVARPGVVERANLRHAVEALERVETPRGLVLNAVGREHTGYYYGAGYYYYQASYGRDAAKGDGREKAAAS